MCSILACQLHKVSQFDFRFPPLLPDICPDSVPQSSLPFLYFCLYIRYPVVVHPFCHLDICFLHDLSDIDPAVSLRDCAQSVLRFYQRLGMDAYEQTIFSLTVYNAHKLKFFHRINFGNVAFLPIHLALQFSFQISYAAFQQWFYRSRAFAQQYDAIRISKHRHAALFVFPVEFIHVHIDQ